MSIGIWQVILILMIVLILFGAGKLPKVMGDVAKGVKSFKSGLKDDEDDAPKTITAERATPAATPGASTHATAYAAPPPTPHAAPDAAPARDEPVGGR
ncbi:MAG: twin-arginine translocase TatA/TatE family subunit [Geminicoccaceae bacterium]|nr:twin-arginine translocase TatA/TatE family subunit [Geminicoccaceae bacterium]